jgi:hypothetical protein
MTFEYLVERVRFGVQSGVFTVGLVTAHLTACGYHSTRDVPEGEREQFLADLVVKGYAG